MIRKIWRVRRVAAALACGTLSMLAASCARNIEVPASVPTPLMAALPVTIGVYYDEEFSNYLYIEKLLYGPEINVELGEANVNMFDRMVDSVFSAHVPLDEPRGEGVDAIIAPSVDEYAFLTPDQSGVDFYSVSIRYKVDLLSPSGDVIDSWKVDSYGRTRATGLVGTNSLSQANEEALRDAAAVLALDLQNRPSVVSLSGEGS